MAETFLYFAYGSNLLAKRIHINNPSAVRAGIAKLMNYQLDFGRYSETWKGAAATIIENNGNYVWGAIWELDSKHKDTLDKQEGVDVGIYKPLEIQVITPEGIIKNCRSYQQLNVSTFTEKIEDLADERKPSSVYLDVIKKGAKESNLPDLYQKFLARIPDNGYNDTVEIDL